jgi:hypothetical protein
MPPGMTTTWREREGGGAPARAAAEGLSPALTSDSTLYFLTVRK